MNNPRSRLACASCTRRKVKCSKTVPCSNCIRRLEVDKRRPTRGEQQTCGTSSNDYRGSATIATTAEHEAPAISPSLSPGDTRENELSFLRRRIAQLENELRHRPSPTAAVTDRPMTRENNNRDKSPSAETVAEDAASILEFLAWGRRKNPELPPVASPEVVVQVSPVGDIRIPQDTTAGDMTNLEEAPQMSVLQLLLPNRRQTWDLVLWHEQCLLWYHCSYHAPSLRYHLENFYVKYDGSIEHPEVNLQWVAFLFAVLAGSMTCLPNATAEDWGFSNEERDTLSRRWFQAAITCLNRADFAANHSILSIQAIATLTMSAHTLGFSNLQSTYLAAAVRIAQSFGLHRLTMNVPGGLVEKEAGRRAWLQLCSQDWFSLPFSDTYLINPLYSKSELPLNCHDEDLTPLPSSVPTVTGYSRFLGSIANIMPRLQDGLMSCNTPFTKYEQVMKWDKQLRTIATSGRPEYLCGGPIDPEWPAFVPWARRALAISSAHKIIMIHRSFLSESFSNPAFAFTRRTCLAASKTIIKEYKWVVEEDGPMLWIYQAFAVAASIILILDVLHREPDEPETSEHFVFVQDTLEILKKCQNSMIAIRGTKLLSSLLGEASITSTQESRKRRAEHDGSMLSSRPRKRKRSFNVPAFVKSFCEEQKPPNPQPADSEVTTSFLPMLTDTFLEPGAFEESAVEDLLYLANQDFHY